MENPPHDHSGRSPDRACPARRRARMAARWLLAIWAGAALAAWFVPWRVADSTVGIAAPLSGWLAVLVPAGPMLLVLLAVPAWRAGRTSLAVVVVLGAGMLHTLGSAATLAEQTPVFDQRVDCRIVGRTAGLVDEEPARRRFRLVLEQGSALVPTDDDAARVCSGLPPGARLRLSDYGRDDGRVELAGGRRYAMVARLKPLHGHANPGGFDYRRWLFRHRIVATGYLREPPTFLGAAAGWQAVVDRVRSVARRHLAESVRRAASLGGSGDGWSPGAGAAKYHPAALIGAMVETDWVGRACLNALRRVRPRAHLGAMTMVIWRPSILGNCSTLAISSRSSLTRSSTFMPRS